MSEYDRLMNISRELTKTRLEVYRDEGPGPKWNLIRRVQNYIEDRANDVLRNEE
jgi:hypothetical protein